MAFAQTWIGPLTLRAKIKGRQIFPCIQYTCGKPLLYDRAMLYQILVVRTTVFMTQPLALTLKRPSFVYICFYIAISACKSWLKSGFGEYLMKIWKKTLENCRY